MANKKVLVLEFDKNVDEEFKSWTKEAVQEFIDLFPEYKDNFQINENKSFFSKAEVEEIINKSRSVSSDDVWNMFELQPDGRYLRKESIDWDIKQTQSNGRIDLQQWIRNKNGGRNYVLLSDAIAVSVTSLPTTMGYGISNEKGPCVSAGMCGKNKEYFKDIIKHELGHTFNATHKDRAHTVENLGSHCTDADCLMYEYAYTKEAFNRRQHKQKPLFCNECMDSMREYMENKLQLENKNKRDRLNNLQVQNTLEEIQPEAGVGRAFKTGYREIFKTAAEKEGAVYKEDLQSKTYSATITNQDGSVDKIQASSATNVSLSSKDKDGKPQVPDNKRFENLADYAHKQGLNISFGNIKSAEFKAKLMLACLTHEPPVKMTGAPELTPEWMSTLTPQTKTALEQALRLQVTNQDQPSPQPQTKSDKAKQTPPNLRAERGSR